MNEIGNALTLFAVFGFVAFLIWHGDRKKQAVQAQRASERERLLDRIGTGEALTRFLQTEDGKRLLDEIDRPRIRRRRGGGNIRLSIIGLLTVGVIALPIGAGFFYVAPDVEPDLVIAGALIGGAGAGCLVAALIHYVLGKAWGMFKSEEENGRSKPRLE